MRAQTADYSPGNATFGLHWLAITDLQEQWHVDLVRCDKSVYLPFFFTNSYYEK